MKRGLKIEILVGLSTILILSLYFIQIFQLEDQVLEKSVQISKVKLEPGGIQKFRFNDRNRTSAFRLHSSCEINVAIILCEDRRRKGPNMSSSPSNDFNRQINQTLVLLKSIIITSLGKGDGEEACTRVIIVSDRRAVYERLKEAIFIKEAWAPEFTRYLKLSHVLVSYPPGTAWMRRLFRPCATLRLFLHSLLPDLSRVIYLDTDIILLRSLRDLWAQFREFKPETLGGLGPCLFHYGTDRNRVPYFGPSGLNAGIMLMDLDRMRRAQWTHKIVHNLLPRFRAQIKLADQDILNIYFHFHPQELHVLSCDWNFRPFQCRPGSACEAPGLSGGISALHGNALSFTDSGPEPLFRAVYEAYSAARLHVNFSVRALATDLDTRLFQAEEAAPSSDCVKYGAFNVLVLSRLDRLGQIVEADQG